MDRETENSIEFTGCLAGLPLPPRQVALETTQEINLADHQRSYLEAWAIYNKFNHQVDFADNRACSLREEFNDYLYSEGRKLPIRQVPTIRDSIGAANWRVARIELD